MDPVQLKDQACAQVYFSRMSKLQQKLGECGTFQLLDPFLPQQFIDVGWGDKDTDNVALFGNKVMLSRTWEKPTVIFESSDNVFYTIVALDADYSGGPYLLWVRQNITGDIQYSSGRDLVRWQPPHPQDDGTYHRIFVFVFHQSNGEIPFDSSAIISKNSRESRAGFDLRRFAQQFSLVNVIGANCWRVCYDDAVVPKIQQELRDRVFLDPTGRKVLAEENDGKRVEYS